MEIKPLKGYQTVTPESFVKGCNVWFNGELYNILDFKPEYVDLKRIAISLAKIKRYIGHSDMSVAQHSVQMAHAFLLMGDVDKAFEAWGHDQSEAYVGDMVGPLKKLLAELFTPIEEGIEKVCAEVFGYNYPFSPEVMLADKSAAQIEMTMMAHADKIRPDHYWSEEVAAQRYLEMYEILKVLKLYQTMK